MGGWVGGWVLSSCAEWVDGWMGGWGLISCGRGEDKGGAYSYESYEVKRQKGKKLHCLLLLRIFFLYFFCYEVFAKQKKRKRFRLWNAVFEILREEQQHREEFSSEGPSN
jgi:hypothetical protein